MISIVEESVLYLFNELKLKNVPIVILRNYENLPNVGNDLDVAIRRKDIHTIRDVFNSEYIKVRWTQICEVCTHNSAIDENNIFVFKFFNTELDIYLQIDFFQGFLFKGQPIISNAEMIKSTRELNGFPIVSIEIEAFIKYYQILSAIDNQQWERVAKYSNKVLALTKDIPFLFNDFNAKILNDSLLTKDYKRYKALIKNYRAKKLYSFFVRNPLLFIRNIICRLNSFYNFFITDPFIVKCTFSDKIDKLLLKETLDGIIANKGFRGYCIPKEMSFAGRIKRILKLSISGGIIVYIKESGKMFSNKEDIKEYIVEQFVTSHQKIK